MHNKQEKRKKRNKTEIFQCRSLALFVGRIQRSEAKGNKIKQRAQERRKKAERRGIENLCLCVCLCVHKNDFLSMLFESSLN
jgi:hypothetical protein